MFSRIFACFLFTAQSAMACDLALVLAVDVSGSVDPQEYRIQMDGLAEALRDGVVAEALLNQQAMVTLVQWTGSSRQRQTLPWTKMSSFREIDRFADRIEADPRVWRNYSTAIGEALAVGEEVLREVPQCRRKVIDVSGDGRSNEGTEPRRSHEALRAGGITVNGLAIETDDTDLTGYFFENVIIGENAFVETADGFMDYPASILRKLQRETAKASAALRYPDRVIPIARH